MNSETKLSHNKFLLSIIIILSLVASSATCYFATPTVFGGRDQGAIATAAINLIKYKSFTYKTPVSEDLFQKYGSGKALNYPGFDYTKDGRLVSRFPKVYIVYLAGLYGLFGLKGIQYANFIPLVLFFILFWLTLRYFFSGKVSFLGFLLALTFFPFLWFAKYTLTEIFMLFLVWAGIYFLIESSTLRSKKVEPCLYLSLAFFALSALTRIEGIIFFLLAASYIYILKKKKIISLSKDFQKYLITFILFLLILYLFLNFPTLLDSAKNIIKAFLPDSTKDSAPSVSLYARLVILFFKYNFLSYLILGIAGIGWLAKNIKKNWLKPKFIPILITFPAFLYLISPMITLDDPWLLRRFVFAVFPALIFYSIYFLNRYSKNKIMVYAIFFALLVSNLVITGRYITYSENKNLLPQVENLSKKFGANDLIFIDRLASGSGWSLISEPLSAIYQKQAVYFFNADDLKYIKKDNYKNIYLIAPPAEKDSWYTELVKGRTFDMLEVNNNFLEPSEKKWGLAQNIESKTLTAIWKIK